jgi:hypothetical protein
MPSRPDAATMQAGLHFGAGCAEAAGRLACSAAMARTSLLVMLSWSLVIAALRYHHG